MYYIYKIENKVNHKKYIGLTNNIARRRARHFTDLRCHRHDNSFLQKEFDIYGQDNFDFTVEFEGDVTAEEIGLKEREYISFYDSYRNGYNQNEGGNFGPSNGGSHLTQSDIFNILAAVEFTSRPGAVLSKMFDVSVQTISRIKHGENHSQYKAEYEKLSLEERKALYDIFVASNDFLNKKANSTVYQSKRKLTEKQIHLVLLNEERGRIIPMQPLTYIFGLNSDQALRTIILGKSYLNYALSYKTLTEKSKENLVSLLRQLADETRLIAGTPQKLKDYGARMKEAWNYS